jgi:two-component system, chemotaxis family, chemotaxis protein CheY
MSIPNKNIRIMVVDDFPSQRDMVKHCLKELELYNICEANNGETALDKLKTEKVDFIISDWTMPNMTGIEFLRQVRANGQWQNIPFLMITAEAQKTMVVEAIQAGVSNFIVKPFTAGDLEKKMTSIFKNWKK